MKFQWSKSEVATSTEIRKKWVKSYWVSVIEIGSGHFNQIQLQEPDQYKLCFSDGNRKWPLQPRFSWCWLPVPTGVSVIEIGSGHFNSITLYLPYLQIKFQWSKSEVATSTFRNRKGYYFYGVSVIEIGSGHFNWVVGLFPGYPYNSFSDRNRKWPLQLSILLLKHYALWVSVIEIGSGHFNLSISNRVEGNKGFSDRNRKWPLQLRG